MFFSFFVFLLCFRYQGQKDGLLLPVQIYNKMPTYRLILGTLTQQNTQNVMVGGFQLPFSSLYCEGIMPYISLKYLVK